jgi:hypothetical protein
MGEKFWLFNIRYRFDESFGNIAVKLSVLLTILKI